jgi:hypothetical protein
MESGKWKIKKFSFAIFHFWRIVVTNFYNWLSALETHEMAGHLAYMKRLSEKGERPAKD